MTDEPAENRCLSCSGSLADLGVRFCPHCGWENKLPAVLTEGRFRPIRLLGQGGMGTVYLVEDTRLEVNRAIKFVSLPDEFAPEELDEMNARIIQEARAAQIVSQHTHHVVQVFDVGLNDDDRPYLVMEYLEGITLKERLKKSPLPLELALDIGRQIAHALSQAHRSQLIHRDLKPENIMLTTRDSTDIFVKLLDFGLVKMAQSKIRTESGAMLGTLEYMAPEQVRGQPVDARTDIFALGAILFECVTGQRANPGPSHGELLAVLLESGIPPVRRIAPHLPIELSELIDRCLALAPGQRPSDVNSVETQLIELQSRLMADSESVVIPGPSTKDEQPRTESSVLVKHSKLWPWPILSLAVLVLISLALVYRHVSTRQNSMSKAKRLQSPSSGSMSDQRRDSPKTLSAAQPHAAKSIVADASVPLPERATQASSPPLLPSKKPIHIERLPAEVDARIERMNGGTQFTGATPFDAIAAAVSDLALGPWPQSRQRWAKLAPSSRMWLWQIMNSPRPEERSQKLFISNHARETLKTRVPRAQLIPKLGRILISKKDEIIFEMAYCRSLSRGDRLLAARSTVRGYQTRTCAGVDCPEVLTSSLKKARSMGERAHLKLTVTKSYQRTHAAPNSSIECTVLP